MACECNYVMLSVSIILFLGVASQTISVGLPGWISFVPKEDVLNVSTVVYEKGQRYTYGLWTECKGSLSGCDGWIDDSLKVAESVGRCSGDTIVSLVPGITKPPCRDYNNLELTMWVTQVLGLILLAVALVFSILASIAFCCSAGGCCGDCCVGFCKFLILLICMMAAMSLTCGLVLFGVTYAEDLYKKVIFRQGYPVVVKELQVYYSYALSALAAILAVMGAIITAFSRNDDGKV